MPEFKAAYQRTRSPEAWVVTGVSGVGKTSVGRALAARLGLPYADGDDFHAPESIAKMRAGLPLEEHERAPWLARVGRWLNEHQQQGGVISCSALRRSHRDALRSAAPSARFVQLVADPERIAARLAARTDHFMPASLLPSQLAILEPLQADEQGLSLEIRSRTPEELASLIDAYQADIPS
jgi:gluconokinase